MFNAILTMVGSDARDSSVDCRVGSAEMSLWMARVVTACATGVMVVLGGW